MGGIKTWATNDVLTASDLNTYVRDQVVAQVTSGTRPAGTEGQMIYETDTDRLWVYSGATWVEWGGIGAWISYTPVLTQSGAVTKTTTYAKYQKMGRWVTVNLRLDITGTGSANNAVTVSAPFTLATSAANLAMGSGWVYDSSATTFYPGIVIANSTTAFGLLATDVGSNVYVGQTGSTFSAAFASGDAVSMQFSYESTT